MCEANVYLKENGKEELLLKEVDVIRPQEDGLFMRSIFGEQKNIKARITEINLIDHKIIVEKI
ncbi:MAG: CooT family nickel-binding protein [Planctomycetes bacterium]|nr:CooT family nickel-binding protein [Planctomycetota bacterium]